MKVLLISASPRKARSQTLALAKHVVKGLGKSAKVETVHLRDLKVQFCTHCEACHVTCLHCPIKDDVRGLLDKMLSADGIILATPNYINQVTGALKAVMDRSSHFIHCKRLLGKHLCGVVTSGSGAQDDLVLDYLKHYAHMCGAQFSGGVSASAYAMGKRTAAAQRLGKKLGQDIAKGRQDRAQAKAIQDGIAYFGRIIAMRKDHWRGEYEYWKGQRWL